MSAPTEPVIPPAPAAPVPPQGPAGSAPAPKPKRKAALGTWAIVLGIIGIVFGLTPASGFGIFLGAVALLLGGIGLLRKGGRALPGSIVAAVALILSIIVTSVHGGSASSAPASDTSAVTSSSTAPSTAPAKAAAPAKKAAPVKKPAAPAGTAAELQALASAKLYLSDGQGFSQAGLLEQLTSTAGSGFTQADAQWAIAHSGADWNAQALSAAKTYLADGQGFSQASLTSQLTSAAGNKFTASQAQYAVAHAGADWNAQAVDAAKGYMATGMGFSRQSLIQQLTSAAGNQFTPAQASYAADQVGLK